MRENSFWKEKRKWFEILTAKTAITAEKSEYTVITSYINLYYSKYNTVYYTSILHSILYYSIITTI